MTNPLVTDEQRAQLLANGQITAEGGGHDPLPVAQPSHSDDFSNASELISLDVVSFSSHS